MKSLLLPMALLFLLTAPAHASGTDIGRGGDSIALDFKSVATYDLAVLRQHASEINVNLAQLEKTVAGAQLETQDRVFLGAVEKDAVNFSAPDRIVIGSARWLQLPLTDARKDALVLHEYLSLMGLDDSAYAISGKLLAILNARPTTTPMYSCELIKDPKGMPQYLDRVRIGGDNNLGGLGAEKIRVQIYINAAGSEGNDLLIDINDGATTIGMLELPMAREFPPTIYVTAIDRQGTAWMVDCSR